MYIIQSEKSQQSARSRYFFMKQHTIYMITQFYHYLKLTFNYKDTDKIFFFIY